MFVELRPDGTLEQGQRLAQLGLDLGDLEFNLEQVSPGGNQTQQVHARRRSPDTRLTSIEALVVPRAGCSSEAS